MKAKIALTLALLSLCSAFPTHAAETSPLKCGVNEDRVWVYDSLNSYDVAMKLKCGEPVEVIGREKGYVKIRTSGGREGYVEAKAIPKPAATEEDNASGAETQPGQPERQSVVAAARAKNPANDVASANVKPVTNPTSADATKPAMVAPPIPRGKSADGAAYSTTTIPAPSESKNSVASSTTALNSKQPNAGSNAARSAAKPSTKTSTGSATKASEGAGSSEKTVPVRSNKAKSSESNSAENSGSKTSVAKANSGKTVRVSSSSAPAPKTPGAAISKTSSSKTVASSKPAVAAAAPALPVSNAGVVLADNVPSQPVPAVEDVHVASPRDPDEEEEPVMEPLERKENCRIYFSAYGLSPNQYRWMTQNRGKNFSGICPSPSPSMVDFVVIFTHDADFFNGTMPTPVHTDKNGFSDFTPLTTIDTAVVSPSDADKNRREYVWVFHTKRGTFDPAKFSPRRKPLFSTTESNKIGTAAGSRSAEDALRFIEQQGVIQ
jgi:Bacterial SH3 domain